MSNDVAVILALLIITASLTTCEVSSMWAAVEQDKVQLERDKLRLAK